MNKMELMTPKIDFIFKLIFGDEKDTSFLNAVLDLTGEKAIDSDVLKRQKKENEGIFVEDCTTYFSKKNRPFYFFACCFTLSPER